MRSSSISKSVLVFVAMNFVAAFSWAQGVDSACASINNLKDAESCFVAIAEDMGSENDPNAVLVSASTQSKALLIEILNNRSLKKDVVTVKNADYVAAIVENNDEARVHYFVARNGSQSVKAVGPVIDTVDLGYEFCPRDKNSLPAKFAKVQNLLLGMDPEAPVAGTVWLSDVVCEE